MTLWCLNKGFQLTGIIGIIWILVSFCADVCLAMENKTFDGSIDFQNNNIAFRIDLKERGEAKVSGMAEGSNYGLNIALRHIKFGKSLFSSDFSTSGILSKTENGRLGALRGKAWTQASVLNFMPLKEFCADYELTAGRLIIHSLSWANFKLNGQITRADSSDIFKLSSFSDLVFDLFLVIEEMDLNDLAGLLGVSPETIELEGKVSGQVRIVGQSQAIKIEAKLSAYEGRFSRIKFKSARINLEGFWPMLRFIDGSQINDAGGVVYTLAGKFNLRELSDFNSSQHQVMVYCLNNAMRLQDWVIRRDVDYRGQEIVEAEYDLEKNQALKMRIKDQEEILGWEKTVKF